MIDYAKVKIKAGNGGDGVVHFRHEKYVPKGGPDGGDGGKGGDIYLVVNENLTTLMEFRTKSVFKAEDGERGSKNHRTGASSFDLYMEVPSGTIVKVVKKQNNEEEIAVDLTKEGQTYLIARGGLGGKGNFRFRSSTNRTPMQFTPGEEGDEKELILEVKLIADIGLVGLPNAGKSTLLNVLTFANAKVGNYPFTTLEPNLGVMDVKDRRESYVVADLPGLIEGASEGKGLGGEFLRHTARTRLLVHLIDPFSSDPVAAYKTIRNELSSYSKELSKKKEIIVINKIDITEVKDCIDDIKKAFKKIKIEPLFISGATGEGIENLKNRIADEMHKLPKTKERSVIESKTYTISNLPNKRMVFKGKASVKEMW